MTGAVPAALGNLANLESLALSDNQLTGTIPEELGRLINLDWLSLGGNQLTGTIPEELGHLTNLKSLHLYRQPVDRDGTGGAGQPDQPETAVPL